MPNYNAGRLENDTRSVSSRRAEDAHEVDSTDDVVIVLSDSEDESADNSGMASTSASSQTNTASPNQLDEMDSEDEPTPTFGQACMTSEGRLAYVSKLYPGVTFQFSASAVGKGGARRNYACYPCVKLARKYYPFCIVTRTVTTLNGEIVDRDPDECGTNYGHLCRKPELIAQFEQKLKGCASTEEDVQMKSRKRRQSAAATVTANAGGEADTNAVPVQAKQKKVRRSAPLIDCQTQPRLADDADCGKTTSMQSESALTPAVFDASDNSHTEAAMSEGLADQVPVPELATTSLQKSTGVSCAYSANFGPVEKSTEDPSVVYYEGQLDSLRLGNIFGGKYAFKLVREKQLVEDGTVQTIRTYRCQACVDAVKKRGLNRDVPLVKTVNDVFVERDPDCPLGNDHPCIQ